MASSDLLVFVGSNNRTGERFIAGQGVAVLRFDEETLAAETIAVADDIDNPSFLAFDAGRSVVYAVSEVGSWLECTISAYRFDRAAGTLAYLNKQIVPGRTACHVGLVGDDRLVVSNYSHGTGGPDRQVVLYGREADGRLTPPLSSAAHRGTGPNAERQERSHAHSALPTPDGKFVLAADLGTDELVGYRIEGDRLERAFAHAATPGAGPRHFAFHPNGRFVYVINELAASVSVLGYDGAGLERLQEVSILPEGSDATAWAADIHVSADGRFVYASNRGYDSIAVLSVSGDGASVAVEAVVPSGGSGPRSFALTPSGRHVLVANHSSDRIAVFSRDAASGALADTGQAIAIGTPMRVEIVASS